jgi:hypothetical protein
MLPTDALYVYEFYHTKTTVLQMIQGKKMYLNINWHTDGTKKRSTILSKKEN